jgi:putative transposase
MRTPVRRLASAPGLRWRTAVPRRRRLSSAGLIFHIVNRGAKRAPLFEDASEFDDFERLLKITTERFGISLFAYCLMPNHWHLLISIRAGGSLSSAMHWLTTTHARRWQIRRAAEGLGAVYQGRFRAIPVEGDQHFLWVCRYVERNALRARLVDDAASWRWCSLWHRLEGNPGWLSAWPVARGADWTRVVNTPQTDAELAAFRTAVNRGQPFGSEEWKREVGSHLPRRRGRPRRPGCPRKMTPDPLTG